MHSKNNRQNSDFQIAYFLAGSCHTPDGAYALLCDQRDGRRGALAHAETCALHAEAKRIRADRKLLHSDESERLEGQAELKEMQATADTERKCIEAAKAELVFIEKCIAELQPQRKYAHLPDPEAFEAAQREEWRLEFIRRAENFLATGGIPADEFGSMRLHPDFTTHILPAIENARMMIGKGEMQKLIAAPKLKLAEKK